jgi:hypothetical protein
LLAFSGIGTQEDASMSHHRTVIRAASAAVLLVIAACSSSHSPTGMPAGKGAVALKMKASGTVAAATSAGGVAPDTSQGPKAATITISAASAQNSEGTMVPLSGTFPQTVDLLALASNGGSVTLPADLLPEGTYSALQITITQASVTLQDGTVITVTPPGTGWQVTIKVSFTVVAGQETTITLNLNCGNSFHFLNGELEFNPEIDLEDVQEHDD